MIMKALTVYEPWASLVALREKKFETRSWATSYRGTLAIHAGKKLFNTASYLDRELYPFAEGLKLPDIHSFDTLPYGCIIAVCNLVDCCKVRTVRPVKREGKLVRTAFLEAEKRLIEVSGNELAFGDYTPGRFAWKLEDVHRLILPIQTKGRQKIWNWDPQTYEIAIDPWVIGPTKIYTPKGIMSGQQIPKGKEDAVYGLEVVA